MKILLQTTIPYTADDWNIDRFSLLAEELSSIEDESGRRLCNVIARDREINADGVDPVLAQIADSDFDEFWLFAVDTGNGLSSRECESISDFRRRGGGILATRDHQDLGSSLCMLAGIGAAHYFHSRNLDPDESRRADDNPDAPSISWPNYQSGNNGDYQEIQPVQPVHDLLRDARSPDGLIHTFPAHPHEGGVGVPEGESHARVIATGTSVATGRPFNLAVAFEWTARATPLVAR
jgi:hypothetical protein